MQGFDEDIKRPNPNSFGFGNSIGGNMNAAALSGGNTNFFANDVMNTNNINNSNLIVSNNNNNNSNNADSGDLQTDILAMAGINEDQESSFLKPNVSRRFEPTVVIPDVPQFVHREIIEERVKSIAQKNRLRVANQDVNDMLWYALEMRLRDMLEQLFVASEHRYEVFRGLYPTTITSDTRRQLQVFSKIDHARELKRLDAEKDAILKAYKNRKNLDEEQRERARKMQALIESKEQTKKTNDQLHAAFGTRPAFMEQSVTPTKSAEDSPVAPQPEPMDTDEFIPVGADGGLAYDAIRPTQPAPKLEPKPIDFTLPPYPHTVTLKDLLLLMESDPKLKRSPLYLKAMVRQASVGTVTSSRGMYM